MKEQLIHILDQSVCLSRKQMKEYLSGAMLPEEAHAAEIHLCACPLCSMAMEGFEQHTDEALAAIASLNSGFLKEHFANIAPQIHLNSIAPAAAMPAAQSRERQKGRVQPIWRVASVAAGALLVFGLLWAIERSGRHTEPSPPSRLATARSGGNGSNGGNPAATVAAPPAYASDASPAYAAPSKAAATTTAPAVAKSPAAQHDAAPATATTVSGALQAPPATAKDAASKPAIDRSPAAAPVAAGDATSKDAKIAAAGKSTIVDPPALKVFKEYNEPAEGQDEAADPKTASATATGGATTRQRAASAETSKLKSPTDQRSEMERGNAFYDKSNYNAALVHFKKELNNTNLHTRNQAAMMAAQCYIALGNNAKAVELLQRVVDNGSGPERRSARRTLRRLK